MNTVNSVGRLLAVSALAALPALLALLLLGRYFHADMTAFSPAYDFDQYIYTREAATFAAAGVHGGYYGGDGKHARIGRFGPHGAAYAMVYGGLAKVFGGWRDWLAPACNLGFLTLALVAFARGTPLGAYGATAFVLALFPPLLVLLPTAYQDAPQCALGLVVGAALAALAAQGARASRRRLWGTLALVLAASLTRPTWAVVFPAVFFCASAVRIRDAVRSVLAGGVALAVAFVLFSLTAAPWILSPGTNPGASALHGGGSGATRLFLQNLHALVGFADNRYHLLVLLLMLSATVLALAVPTGGRAARLRAAAVHLCNMGGPLVAYVAVYNGSGRHLTRLMAAHFVLSLAFAVKSLPARSRALILAWTAGGCLALLPATLSQYALFVRPAYDDFPGYNRRIAAQAAAMGPTLALSLQAASPWLKTLALPASGDPVTYLAAPPAYGIELYDPAGLEKPLLPGFALLDATGYAAVSKHTPLTPVAETPQGTLYRNDVAFGFAGPAEAGK